MRIVFILSVDLTQVGKEMKFLSGYLGAGVICLKVKPLAPERLTSTPAPVCPLHCGVWEGGGWDRPRLTGGHSLP